MNNEFTPYFTEYFLRTRCNFQDSERLFSLTSREVTIFMAIQEMDNKKQQEAMQIDR